MLSHWRTIIWNAQRAGVVASDKKLFKRLVDSIGQIQEMVHPVRAPSPQFSVDAAKVKEIRAITGLSQPKLRNFFTLMLERCATGSKGGGGPTGPAQALL